MSIRFGFTSDSRKATLTQEEFGQKIVQAILDAIKTESDWSKYSIKIEFAARPAGPDSISIANVVIAPSTHEEPEAQDPINFMEELQKL